MAKSSQYAEVHAVLLVMIHSGNEGHKLIHIYSDSWCICNCVAIWSAKWKKTNWKINGKGIWSKQDWIDIDNLSQRMKVLVTHVDAHTA